MKTFAFVALSCVLISLTHADTTPQMNVVYLEAKPTETDQSIIQTNLKKYLDLMDQKNIKNPDIVVLPEYGLSGTKISKDHAIAIDQDTSKWTGDLKYLRDNATTRQIILVANLLENDDDDLYSTTVVIDGKNKTNQALLAKYRKINLKDDDNEKLLKSGDEIVTFKHSVYGIIGLLSGDDILNENPILKLKDQVTTILCTSSQKVVAPFENTVSLHAGIAKALGVNLVVSSLSANNVSGSGIYTPCGSNVMFIDDNAENIGFQTIKVIPDTKCNTNGKSSLQIKLFTTGNSLDKVPEYNFDNLDTELLNGTLTDHKKCRGSFCCNFTIEATWDKNEFYRIAVSDESPKICGLMRCSTNKDELNSNCGIITGTINTVFTQMKIITSDGGDSLFIPYSLDTKLKPGVGFEKLTFTENKDETTVSVASIQNMVAFGIVALKSAAIRLGVALNLLVLPVFLKYMF